MQFFKVDILLNNDDRINNDDDYEYGRRNRKLGSPLAEKCNIYTMDIADKGFFFLDTATSYGFTMGIIMRDYFDVDKFISRFMKREKISPSNIKIQETTFRCIQKMLRDSERFEYIWDTDETLCEFGISELDGGGRFGGIVFDERMIVENTPKIILSSANNYHTQDCIIVICCGKREK